MGRNREVIPKLATWQMQWSFSARPNTEVLHFVQDDDIAVEMGNEWQMTKNL
jgi:hypothetical protein